MGEGGKGGHARKDTDAQRMKKSTDDNCCETSEYDVLKLAKVTKRKLNSLLGLT